MTETNVSLPREEWASTVGVATWMTRYLDPSGFVCQILLESESGRDVLSKAKAAIAYLQESGCIPVPVHGQAVSDRPKSLKQELAVEVKKESSASTVRCLAHGGVPMQQYTKGNHSWFAHRWEGKWCKGKWS